jgi:hypothetical protein
MEESQASGNVRCHFSCCQSVVLTGGQFFQDRHNATSDFVSVSAFIGSAELVVKSGELAELE